MQDPATHPEPPAGQDGVFWRREGDAWFARNRGSIERKLGGDDDLPLRLIGRHRLRPRRVLEVGCSNGWRLGLVRQLYGSDCVGVEPSEEAIASGLARYPELDIRRGTAARLPVEAGERFDLVIVNFVLHWVDRDNLLASVAEIDRAVDEGGFLILGDFLPDYPQRNRYHHDTRGEVYTYKLDYAAIFQSTALYTNVCRETFDHDHAGNTAKVSSHERGVCQLLRKSRGEFYGPPTPPPGP